MQTTRVAVHGATGRMGLEVLREAARQRDRIELAAALVRPGSAFDGEPLARLLGTAAPDLDFLSALDPEVHVDVLIDFSAADSFDAGLALARARRCGFVSGTTGLSAEQQASLDHAAASIPVLWASNFSFGIAVMAHLTMTAARALGPDFDVEIVELHHRNKRDAPSGTAITLAEAVAAVRAKSIDSVGRYARHGQVGPRESGEIGVMALRGGDAIGEHTVLFLGDGERLELHHKVGDRGIFARGAVLAACWLRGRAPGRYQLSDMLDQ